MTSRINAKVATRSAAPTAPKAYSPSVPISLYREVATELQSNQVLLESLKAHNQELTEQNQQLRIEIERVVQSALQLRQKADSFQSNLPGAIVPQPPLVYLDPLPEQSPRPPRAPKVKLEPPREEILFTEQPSHPVNRTQTGKPAEISGWWLALIVISIVVGAFGAGFLIVRPFLHK
jgi:FtsZ-binding cell division protein ZapB